MVPVLPEIAVPTIPVNEVMGWAIWALQYVAPLLLTVAALTAVGLIIRAIWEAVMLARQGASGDEDAQEELEDV